MMKNLITRYRPLLVVSLAVAFLAGCADTKLTRSWTAPEVGSLKFHKIIAIAIGTNRNFNRKMVESAVQNQVTKATVVCSYELLPGLNDLKDKALVLKTVKDSGADGVITLRLVSSDSQVTHGSSSNLPMDYMTFSGYYGSIYDVSSYFLNDGGRSVGMDKILSIETNIYDVKTEKLLYSGLTVSTKDAANPGSVPALILEVGKSIRAQLESQKLIQ